MIDFKVGGNTLDFNSHGAANYNPDMPNSLVTAIQANVRAALDEDIASGDLTAQLIPADAEACARVISRESAVLCGSAWFDACFAALDAKLMVQPALCSAPSVQP